MMNPALSSRHRASFSISAEEVAPGQSAILRWKVVGVEAKVASVHLSSGSKDGLNTVESADAEGMRELIFSRPGAFTFTLIATFGDGTKLTRQVRVLVTA